MTTCIELARDESSAVISPIGASLVSFTVGDRPIVVSMEAFDGAVLAPWPNRIDGGRFDFDGIEHRLPITEPEHDTALHGLVADVDWTVAERTESSVRLEYALAPSEGYPFPFSLSVSYDLAEAGLRISASAVNTGSVRAPFGFGFHPWLSPGGISLSPGGASDAAPVDGVADAPTPTADGATGKPAHTACTSTPGLVDSAQLLIPATTWYETDDRLIPTKVRPFDDGTVIPADHVADESACIVCKDFRALRSIGGAVLDDAFGAPRRGPGGWSRARLRGADDCEIIIGMGPEFRTWQVCTGDGLDPEMARRAIAIEPMTCPPNAFATGESGEDFDTVGPGEELSVAWSISLEASGESADAGADGTEGAGADSNADTDGAA
ncbi:aldose 1-epimerase family protein [Brevibacterium oceani]|uniref:aldose 1-epimerase family protein n=1 Tax=Brevibacterium oceani TaxID=358099 RepID=UPI001FE282BC|nr:aldose 1-epimerase family protein [Brevibacterium oceani]